MSKGKPMSRGAATFAVAGAGLLVVAGGVALWLAAQKAGDQMPQDSIAVTVTDSTCDPADITVPAGKRSFVIHNASDRTLEWEILDGVMVVAERENIVPGLSTTLSPRLKPGEYQITCGLLTNPRGRLTVTPTEASEAARKKPEIREFIGPLSEYRVYLTRRASELTEKTAELRDLIAAGDTEGAKAAWLEARLAWHQMAPIWPRIADLSADMDPLADYLEGRENDPAFTGFHRIEYGLWRADDDLLPFATALAGNAGVLQQRIHDMQVAPGDLAGSPALVAGQIADRLAAGHVSYSGSDLAQYAADLNGIRKSALLIDPLVAAADAAASAALKQAIAQAQAQLDGLKQGDNWPDWNKVSDTDRDQLAAAFRQIADAASAFNPAIGLE